MPNPVLGVVILRFNGLDGLVRPGNYCCSSIRVASVNENKNSHRKIIMTNTQTTCPNRITLRAGKKKGAIPAEVLALVSVFENSATELKQKLLKCKLTIQRVTFNVTTFNKIGQLPELTTSVIDHNIDIICIQEHRYTHSKDIKYHDSGNEWTKATATAWNHSLNVTVVGVGMLIGPQALKSLNTIEKIQHRMMVAIFNSNPNATIISCYSRTNDELSSLVRSIPKHNVLVIGRDMNALIGKNRNHKFSLNNSPNRNGQYLTDFTIKNSLTCLNINFQKREGNWTYTFANNTKVQIDYVFINKKWNNSAFNSVACHGTNTTEPTKERDQNYNHRTQGLGPA